MSDVNFTEEAQPTMMPQSERPKGLYKLVIDLGIAKTVSGARTVLIVVALAAIVLAIAYPFIFG